MSYYEFKEEDAFRFAQMFGPTKRKGKELVFHNCPYCNGGNHHDKFTFAINLDTGMFNCKRGGCNAKGNMITLAHDIDGFDLADDVEKHYNIKQINTIEYRHFKNAHRITESKDEAVEYLKNRGISEAVCRKYEITVDENNRDILIFPFKTEDGELKGAKYRNTKFVKGETVGSKEWCVRDCMPILFGMNHCESFGQLVITEGQIDSLSLVEAGVPNAVSVPTGKNGFSWVPHCWNWMKKFQQIVVFGDNENGEITLAAEINKRFPKITKVVRVEDYQGCKDANELLLKYGKDALLKAVANAEYASTGFIKDMSDVESIDIESLPAISTGSVGLDQILAGGFHYGDFVVLTGRRGEGKSTMASQMVVEALAKGNNCLIYSGEMKDIAVKNWIDRQISGDQIPTPKMIKRCEEFYRGRLFICDDSGVEDETEDLLETIEDAIIQRNVRFILVDNLMTAMEDTAGTNEALFRQQSNFTGKLAKLARKFDVVILLVCHPRKTSNDRLENDDVSGTADITNKANVVLTYSRVFKDKTEIDPRYRDLAVTKNRLTGRQGKVRMVYTDTNKRIVEDKYDLKKDYFGMWARTSGFEAEEIPF